MTHDYKALISDIDESSGYWGEFLSDYEMKAIIRALRIADKLMQEPSDGMVREANLADWLGLDVQEEDVKPIYTDIFKAMRDQMIADIQLTESPENVSYENLTNGADTSQNIEHMEG